MPNARPLRDHQRQVLGIARAIAAGADARDVLAAVTPGGGKSLLPVLMGQALIEAGIVDRLCWVVPRDSLRLQAEEAFADPLWREALGHRVSVRAADNAPDPCRGLSGYITTYQAVAAAPDLHLGEFRRHRTLLVVDEVHHLPALPDLDPDGRDGGAPAAAAENDDPAAWSGALLPLLECARVRLLLSGTLERADGRRILWLPYRRGSRSGTREVDLAAPGWAVVGYSRAQALAERAVLPVTFGALDGEASWLEPASAGPPGAERIPAGPHRLSTSVPGETTRPALFTALRTGFAEALLRESFDATRKLRAERRAALGVAPGQPARGLGKLLVVAADQSCARRYLDALRGWVPAAQAEDVRLATSDERDAHETLAAFRLRPEPSILVTVAMAYEGLDAPEVAVVAALTHIRSRPWLEQMVARATRVDPRAGPYDNQRALVFHPDDPFFGQFRWRMEEEQGTRARAPKPPRQGTLPLWLAEQLAENRERDGITPLESNALALRLSTLRPGPDLAAGLAAARDGFAEAQADLLDRPSVAERRLRARLGELVAAQVIEDEAAPWTAPGTVLGEARGAPRGQGTYHAYNAALKRALGNKGRAEMTLSELEAAVAWMERHRLSDHLHLLDGDHRYGWAARQRGNWQPPVGRRPVPARPTVREAANRGRDAKAGGQG
ncbi:DEAD/DEAH box helicase [Roseomonas sp. BN140053]|uniref:DEAD/DEAH box helicase n=1 Tax=Roseomonas sp. BN140053 TaxID=3391898 RepID=UPI0039EC95B9